MHMLCPIKRSEILHDKYVHRLLKSCGIKETKYQSVWNLCNTDQDKLEVSFKASRMCVAAGSLEESIFWIRRLLPLLRNDPGTNDKELGTFLSILGCKLMVINEPEEAVKVLGEAMLKIKNIPVSQEKDMLVHENYRAFGRSFYKMKKEFLAIYYFTLYLSFDHLVEERWCTFHVKDVNYFLSCSYYCLGRFEQSIKYARDSLNMDPVFNDKCMFVIGEVLRNIEDIPNAYKYHVDVFKIRKCHPDPVFRQNYLHQSYACVAHCQMKMKYYSLAIKNYDKAINLFDYNCEDLLVDLRNYFYESSHCHSMLGQFQKAHDVGSKVFNTMENVRNSNRQVIPFACFTINIELLKYKMKKEKEKKHHAPLSTFFDMWMMSTVPIRFVAMCLGKLFTEDLALFNKLINLLLDTKRRNPQVVAQEIRPRFQEVFNSVMMSKHICNSVLSLRRSLMNQ
jgi:tetratricopeptide (TPR) repeat protein